jgi:hypothetical protein
MNSQFRLRNLFLVQLALSFVPIVHPAYAQWGQPPKKPPQVNKYTMMSQPAQLNDIPNYTGSAKFQSGATVSEPGEGGGINYMERILTREAIDEVGNWYSKALASYGWKVTLTTRTSVYAHKDDGSSVSINLNGTHEPGWRSVIVINYTPKGN